MDPDPKTKNNHGQPVTLRHLVPSRVRGSKHQVQRHYRGESVAQGRARLPTPQSEDLRIH